MKACSVSHFVLFVVLFSLQNALRVDVKDP